MLDMLYGPVVRFVGHHMGGCIDIDGTGLFKGPVGRIFLIQNHAPLRENHRLAGSEEIYHGGELIDTLVPVMGGVLAPVGFGFEEGDRGIVVLATALQNYNPATNGL